MSPTSNTGRVLSICVAYMGVACLGRREGERGVALRAWEGGREGRRERGVWRCVLGKEGGREGCGVAVIAFIRQEGGKKGGTHIYSFSLFVLPLTYLCPSLPHMTGHADNDCGPPYCGPQAR